MADLSTKGLHLTEHVKDDELALVDELHRRDADEDDDGPLDLHDALAQIGGTPLHSSTMSPRAYAGGTAVCSDTTRRYGGDTDGTQAAEEAPVELESTIAARCAAEPLPCESWFAVGGVHDMDSPLVRVANDDLQEAALRGDVGLVRRLIHAGASVNAPMRPECEDEFMSLLHVLALKPEMPNGSRIMAEIIHRGANLNVRSSLGSTPLACACLSKHVGAVEVLLEARADPSPVDDRRRTATCCAVLPGGEDSTPGYEALALEVVQLLARARADLNHGGEHPPVVHAIRARSEAVVAALLEGGAAPEGLHDAVETAPVAIIRVLVRAEANPFTKDANGKTVMDIALARGDEEVTTLLRDFRGDLQRQQHRHCKTLEEQMKAEALEDADAGRNGSITVGGRRSSLQTPEPRTPMLDYEEEETLLSKVREKLQVACRKINRNRVFQTAMFTCLFAALFLPDMWILLDITSNAVLDIFLCVILVAFTIEFLVQVIGLTKSYTCKFFFWMDLIGVLSVPLDHSLVMNALPMAFDNAVVMRAARMAKLGARAGRFTKLVKLLRFLPGFQEQGSVGTAKVISGKLNMALSTRVSCLIIVMVMVLPLFEFITYPESDFSMKMWVELLDNTAQNSPNGLMELLSDLEAFYSLSDHYPFEAHCTFVNHSTATEQLSRGAPARERSQLLVRANSGDTYLKFNFKSPQQIDALCNCLLITTIMILMLASGLVLTNSVSSIVLVPLELLLSNVQKIASKIFSSVASMSGKANREDDEDEDEANEDPGGGGFGNETQLLEKVLKKLATLSEITANKSPLDAEAFNKLNEGDRALLQGYSGDPAAVPPGAEGGTGNSGESADQERLMEDIDKALVDAGISWEDFDSWDFNVLKLGDPARLSVCVGILKYFHCSAGLGGDSSPEWTACCTRFVEGAARGYLNPTEVPYHNWAHAVDVTFTLFHVLSVAKAEHFLGVLERFALAVGAVGHDMGHPGLNNAFLVETSHELAITYNDQSPLENLHCARLFELTRQPTSAILANLPRTRYVEVRRVCIEAVLHTDYQRHFALVKETQTLHEMNGELFDASEEMYRASCAEFPSREVADFFRSADVKAHLQRILLHFCDVSNPMKPRHLCEAWAGLIVEEFFRQGDREKALAIPVQPLNDRLKVNKAYSQMGFIEFFIAPLAFAMARLMPPLDCLAEAMLENLELWFDNWAEETSPPPDLEQKAKVRDRIAKLMTKWPRQIS